MIEKFTITDIDSVKDFIKMFKEDQPKYTSFDTETTGLNIVKDTPFLFVFGYAYVPLDSWNYKVWLIDIRDVTKEVWDSTLFAVQKLFNQTEYTIGHNIKYDLHMMHNIGYPKMFKNVTDSQIVIRLTAKSLTQREGGIPLDLTGYATRHIDKNARSYQRQVTQELSNLKRQQTAKLLAELKKYPVPEKYGNRKWSMTLVNEITKDKVIGLDNVEEHIRDIILKYQKPISWIEVPREVIHRYAHMDVYYTLRIFIKNYPRLLELEHEEVFLRENSLIIPLYESERLGFPFDKDYAKKAHDELKQTILDLRKRLYEIAGEEVSVGQHQRIKEIVNEKFKYPLMKTDIDALEDISTPKEELLEFRDLIITLRTLEKWYSTYLVGYMDSEYEGLIRTQFNQVGTVTGRLSSGFQQFPRRGISHDGKTLFHPRKLIKVNKDSEYDRLAYIDYSQIELRVQAIYTILISGGDLNLCRSFMPFKCVDSEGNEYVNGQPFSHTKWYLKEDTSIEWKPVDVHTKTAETAFGKEAMEQDYDYYRSIGKTTNFASNYGSGVGGIMMALKSTTALAQKMFEAYNNAYPQIFEYRRYVQRALVLDKSVRNLFGRLYFGSSAHKISNYLVQGSAADIIKMKIIELDKYIKEKGYKTRILMNIHDEIQFELHKDEPNEILYEFKEIMEDLGNIPVPIVADIEISYTSWDEAGDLDDSN